MPVRCPGPPSMGSAGPDGGPVVKLCQVVLKQLWATWARPHIVHFSRYHAEGSKELGRSFPAGAEPLSQAGDMGTLRLEAPCFRSGSQLSNLVPMGHPVVPCTPMALWAPWCPQHDPGLTLSPCAPSQLLEPAGLSIISRAPPPPPLESLPQHPGLPVSTSLPVLSRTPGSDLLLDPDSQVARKIGAWA